MPPGLTETGGLTDVQRDIIGAVRHFVDTEILPVATELDHADEYPHQIVWRLQRLGVFGLPPARSGGPSPCRSRGSARTSQRSAPRHGGTAAAT